MLLCTMIKANMWMLYLTFTILSVIQIHSAEECTILSATSPSASALDVVWEAVTNAVLYSLEFKPTILNSSSPVVVSPITTTQKLVQGLQPGNNYTVTLKVYDFLSKPMGSCSLTALTVPDKVQIISAEPVSSSAIRFEWANVTGADTYTVYLKEVKEEESNVVISKVFTGLSGEVTGLTESTLYNCKMKASNSAGDGENGSAKSVKTLVSPPPDANVTLIGKSTAEVTWTPVDGVLEYQVTVTDIDTSNTVEIQSTSDTSVNISNLEPCSNYIFGVSCKDTFLRPGQPIEISLATSNINRVTTITVDYNCSNATATVTWHTVFGGNSYRASVTDGSGDSLNCTSDSTSCDISMLKCGQKYSVHVTAISDDCSSTSIISKTFETVPCAPANPHIQYKCSNTITFEWEATNNTDHYVATSTDSSNQVIECRTPGTKCVFPNIDCGETYTFIVKAISPDCESDVTESQVVTTTPCIPQNIQTLSECTADSLLTTWDAANGAESYTVVVLTNLDENYTCTTPNNSCELTGIPCGESVSVWLTASNDICTTPPELGDVGKTVPCPPMNLSATSDCSADSVTFTWIQGRGVVFYIFIIDDSSGTLLTDYTLDPNYSYSDLPCGETYTAKVYGSNFECNTAQAIVTFAAASCPPTNVTAEKDCDNNQVTITWDHEETGPHTAVLTDTESGETFNCTSSNTKSCMVTSPPCGKTYDVTVIYEDGSCLSTSAAVSVDSVPCQPENVEVNMTCSTGDLRVTWTNPTPAPEYRTEITGGTPTQTLLCNSTETQCDQSGLECGSTYMVKVYSLNGSCSSLPSTEVSVHTMPCQPTGVVVQKACSPDNSSVSWAAADGAARYKAVAVSSEGSTSICETDQMSCRFGDLECGQVYSVTVSGLNGTCEGPQSSSSSLHTEPCSPVNVTSELDCLAGTAEVSWAASTNAANYSVKATNTGSSVYCHGPDTSCTLAVLDCNQQHVVTVTASDGMCTSAESVALNQDPVPCAPQNVQTSLACNTNDITVTWDAVSEDWDYNVTAVSVTGQTADVTCSTHSNNCTLTGFQCGQNYSITVVPFSGTCVGPVSSPVITSTGPCGPTDFTTEVTCGSNTLDVSLSSTSGDSSYIVTVSGPNGFSTNCTINATSLSCQITGLQCGTQFNVSAVSVEGDCSSSSTQKVVTTGPCDPTNVRSTLNCCTDSATVTWDEAPGANTYRVKASEDSSLYETACTSDNETSCDLQNLYCGQNYTLTVVSEGDTCNSTGATASLTTAPCPPTIQSYRLICGTSTASLNWTSVQSATGYLVNATASNGHLAACPPTSDNYCTLTGLQCSQTYTVTVVAQGSECDSYPSSNFNISTAPCPPSITTAEYTCSSANISWIKPEGSTSFYAEIGEDHTDSCNTTSNYCEFQNIPCGLSLHMKVRAKGPQCDSDDSISDTFDTVPCAPQNIQTSLACNTNDITVTWDAVSEDWDYNVTAVSVTGQTADVTCSTHSNNCTLTGFQCGQNYSITVVPFSGTCVGPVSSPVITSTGPCGPTDFTTEVTCGSNTLDVSLSSTSGDSSYIVTVSGPNGFSTNCTINATSLSYQITGLQCATQFNVSAVSVEGDCSSSSTQKVVTTGPCDPTNVRSTLNCGTDSATVTWDEAPGANTYRVKASEDSSLYETACTSDNETSCDLQNLYCGQNYTLTVVSEGDTCNSTGATASLTTAPCPPTIQSYHLICGTSTASLNWTSVQSATGYLVNATASNGHLAACPPTSDNYCTLTDLQCSQTYTVTVVAQGSECDSYPSSNFNISTAPCPPSITTAEYTCSSANISWIKPEGSTSFYAEIGEDHTDSCNTTSNYCEFQNIPCGLSLHMKVRAKGPQCDSDDSISDTFDTVPCAPGNVSATLICETDSAMVTWTQSSFAVNYTVTATGLNSVRHCHNVSTSCMIEDLQCGEDYNITVTPHSAECTGFKSHVYTFESGACPPTTASLSPGCQMATVQWSNVEGAEKVVATATDDNGQTYTCESNSTDSCSLDDLPCGLNYSVSVVSVDRGCSSQSVSAGQLETGPCVPVGIFTNHSCATGDVTINWQSSEGVDRYIATVTSDSSGYTQSCASQSALSCNVNGLPCGQNFSVSVTASNAQCNTTSSESVFQATAPCSPTNVEAVMDCTTDTAIVSWSASDVADEYTVTDQSNSSVICSGVGLTCNLTNVPCGTQYSLEVVAENSECSSAPSQAVTLTTAPCPPQTVNATIDCATNDLAISWTSSAHTDYYLVSAIAQNGGVNEECNVTNSHCTVNSVSCGNTFFVEVTAVSGTCNSNTNASVLSAPCQPQNVSGLIDCVRNSARISWLSALGADSYTVHALGEQDIRANCTISTNTTCEVELECATHYNFTVTATDDQCESPASAQIELETAPCSLTGIRAFTQCHNSTIHVEWDVVEGGAADTMYIATAEDSNNNNISCNSTGNKCFLQNAQCGLRYTIVVSATSDICNDLRSPPYHVTTEPCKPNAPNVDESCRDAVVSWTLSPIAETYYVFAVGHDGHKHHCNTTFDNCTLTSLHCDEQYSVYVISSHENCSSIASDNVTFSTGPCTPDNLEVTYYCENSSALVTWNESSNAGSYHACAVDDNGSMQHCNTVTPNCTFEGLQCGRNYSFTVLATDGTCNSSVSDPVDSGAVPCPPENVAVQGIPLASIEIVFVSWSESACDDTEYFVTLTGYLMGDSTLQFDFKSGWTTTSFFVLPLPCGSDYNATVKARNGAGESGPSPTISGTTGGCVFVLSTRLT